MAFEPILKGKKIDVGDHFSLHRSGKLYIPGACLGRNRLVYKGAKLYADKKEKKLKIVVSKKHDEKDVSQRQLIPNQGGFYFNVQQALKYLDVKVMGRRKHVKFEKHENTFIVDLTGIA